MASFMDQLGIGQGVNSPLFSFGLGLLGGGLDKRTNFGQDLLGAFSLAQQTMTAQEQREAQRLKNEAARQTLQDQARQRSARTELMARMAPGALGVGNQGAGILSPETLNAGGLEDPGTFGLFAEAFPSEAGGVLADRLTGEQSNDPLITLGNGMQVPFSELPSNAQQLVASGMVPGTKEFRDMVEKAIGGGAVAEAERLQAEAAATMAQIEARREQRDMSTKSAMNKRSIRDTFRNLRELAEINRRLEGTVAEPGMGMNELRQNVAQGSAAVKSFLGLKDADKASQIVNDVKRFETLALNENIENVSTLKENLGGRVTQFEFEKFLQTGPSFSNPADTNRRILADQLEEFKFLANIEGVDVPEWVDEEIKSLRSGGRKKKETIKLDNGATVQFE